MPQQLVDPSTGKLLDVSDEDVAGALAAGFHPETVSDADRASTAAANELNYGGLGGTVKAGLAGVARGATLGLSDVAARGFGGDDTARTLEGLQAQNPITSGVGEFAGMLAPALITGGAATPAGIASSIGRRVTAGAVREGAGVLERAAGHAVGAAAEGSLYGGGQYLSQVALENKPLSAEGFVGAMGKGALFAAPIGGGFSLGGEALLRARSLFPRSQITTEAAAAVKSDATAALSESIADGDAMAQAMRDKIAQADAATTSAGARTQVTRTLFGGGDPAAMEAGVESAANKAQLEDALRQLNTSQLELKDWIAAGGDAELEASMAGVQAPDVQGAGAAPDLDALEGARPSEFGRRRAGRVPTEVVPGDQAPTLPPEAPATAVGRRGSATRPGAPGLDDIRPSADPNATAAFDIKDTGLQFDPETKNYVDPTGAALELTPPGQVRVGLLPRAAPEDATGVFERKADAPAVGLDDIRPLAGRTPAGTAPPVLADARQALQEHGADVTFDERANRQIANLTSPGGGGTMTAINRDGEWSVSTVALGKGARGKGGAPPHETPEAIFARHKLTPRIEERAAEDGRPERIFVHLDGADGGGGIMHVERGDDGRWVMGRTALDLNLRGKGVGAALYEHTNDLLERRFGQTLTSAAPIDRSKQAEALWRRLEQQGRAERVGPEVDGRPSQWRMKPSATLDDIRSDAALTVPGEDGARPPVALDESGTPVLPDGDKFRTLSEDDWQEGYDSFRNSLSKEERDTSHFYAGGGGGKFREVNRELRTDAISSRDAWLPKELDAIIDKHKTTMPIRVYRGLGMPTGAEEQAGRLQGADDAFNLWKDLKPGDKVIDRGYQSTTHSYDYAHGLGGRVTLVVDVPPGYPAAPLPSLNREGEIVLRRDTTYRVLGTYSDGPDKLIAHVRVEPTEARPFRVLGAGKKPAELTGPPVEVVRAGSATTEASGAARIPGTTADRIEVKKVGNWRDRKMEVVEYHDGVASKPRVVSQDEAYDLAKASTPEGFNAHLLDSRDNFTIAAGVPAKPAEIVDNAIYVVKPSELADRGILGNKIRTDDLARGAEGMANPDVKFPTVEIDMAPDGEMFVRDGNHRILNAARTDRPMAVKFFRVAGNRAEETAAGRATRSISDPDIDIAPRIREALPSRSPPPGVAAPADDLLSQLQGTASRLGRGSSLRAVTEAAPVRSEPAISRKNIKRVEAARKAGASSAERRREIHSAVASNLPQELQSTWEQEGYKFLREEGDRIHGVRDPISAASDISEAFTEKYGSASETGRGYEGDRFHRRAEIEAKHAEAWAKEQEIRHLEKATRVHDELALIAKRSDRPIGDLAELFEERAAVHEFEGGLPRADAERRALDDVAGVVRDASEHAAGAGPAGDDDLLAQLRGTSAKLGGGSSLRAVGDAAPARAEYVAAKEARTAENAAHFRGKAIESNYEGSAMAADERAMQQAARDEAARPAAQPATTPEDARITDMLGGGPPARAIPADQMAALRLAEQGSPLGVARIQRDPGLNMGHAKATALRDTLVKDGLLHDDFTISPEGLSAIRARPGALPENPRDLGKMFGIDLASAPSAPPASLGDIRALLAPGAESTTETVVDRALRAKMRGVADDAAIERLLQKRPGKNVDVGPSLERAAKVIGDHEAASAHAADLLGEAAPKTAVRRAEALRAARAAQAETAGASAAKAAENLGTRAGASAGVEAAMGGAADGMATKVDSDIARALRAHDSASSAGAGRAVSSLQRKAAREAAAAGAAPAAGGKAGGVLGAAADVGTALEVMKALGVHTPALSAIPIIGPVLGLFFKARAVLGILGRKGGSVARSTEGLIAGYAAATRERLAAATTAILSGAGRGALKVSEVAAGPAVTLGYKLFPGDGITRSKDPQKLYEARMDEIARALQPGAIDHAIADRYQTSDPELHDAIAGQVQRGIAFLDSKAPKPSILQTMLPGDGPWKPSRAQLDEWGKYVHAVGDPVSVLEDLAKGHVTLEGAETLRVVYPELFAEGRKLLMQAAPKMQRTLPYPTRVAISILYRIPVDGTMAPGHLQYLQAGQAGAPGGSGGAAGGSGPTGAPAAPAPLPALTGPFKLGQNTLIALDRRAGA